MFKSYVCALDIGSSKVAAAVVEMKGRRALSLAVSHAVSRGLKQGAVTDSIELVGCIEKVLKSLTLKSGINIKYVYANISGPAVITKHSRAILPLADRGNKIITATDVQRVDEQARILGSSLEEELIHQIPSSYAIDASSHIANPIGLYSHKLETDLFLVCAKISSVQSLTRVVQQAGYEIKSLLLSGLATAKAVFGKKIQEATTLLCDIGSDITEIVILKRGILRDITVLLMGGSDITSELAEELKVTFELAEDVKVSHANVADSSDEKEILLKKNNIYKPIRRSLISQIATSKAKSMCSTIKDAVEKKIPLTEIDAFLVCGRTVLLEGFIEALENTLGIPVRLGRIQYAQGPGLFIRQEQQEQELLSDINALVRKDSSLVGLKYLTYLTCFGIMYSVLETKFLQGAPFFQPTRNLFRKAVHRLKEVYQEYF